MKTTRLTLAVSLTLTLCAVPARSHAQSASPADHRFDEMEATARRLASAIAMPDEKSQVALGRLREALRRGKLAGFAKDARINGIFAYQIGEGGFLVKVKKGSGLAHILGVDKDLSLALKSVTFGAQAGGGSEWGFGVVMGVKAGAYFGGEYRGDNKHAVAGEESVTVTRLVKKGVAPVDPTYNEIYMIGTASGLSAGAAIGTLHVIVQN